MFKLLLKKSIIFCLVLSYTLGYSQGDGSLTTPSNNIYFNTSFSNVEANHFSTGFCTDVSRQFSPSESSSVFISYFNVKSSNEGDLGYVDSISGGTPSDTDYPANPINNNLVRTHELFPLSASPYTDGTGISPSSTKACTSCQAVEWSGLSNSEDYVIKVTYTLPIIPNNPDFPAIDFDEWAYDWRDHCQGYYWPTTSNTGSCSTSTGTFNSTINGVTVPYTTVYNLQDNETITITAKGDAVLPPQSGPDRAGVGYAGFNCDPSAFDLTDLATYSNITNPCFVGIIYNEEINDINDGSGDSFGVQLGNLTTYWIVPVTIDDICSATRPSSTCNGDANIGIDINGDGCFANGDIIQINYVTTSSTCGSTCANPCSPGINSCFDPAGSSVRYDSASEIPLNVPDGGNQIVYLEMNSGPNGTIGISELINVNFAPFWTRTAVLLDSCAGTNINPTTNNANGLVSGFNPEWSGLTPNTNYIIAVTHSYFSGIGVPDSGWGKIAAYNDLNNCTTPAPVTCLDFNIEAYTDDSLNTIESGRTFSCTNSTIFLGPDNLSPNTTDFNAGLPYSAFTINTSTNADGSSGVNIQRYNSNGDLTETLQASQVNNNYFIRNSGAQYSLINIGLTTTTVIYQIVDPVTNTTLESGTVNLPPNTPVSISGLLIPSVTGGFSGPGISEGFNPTGANDYTDDMGLASFNPATAGVGIHTITYTWNNNLTGADNCTGTKTIEFTVTGDDATFTLTPTCDGATATLDGSATAGGTFSFDTAPTDGASINTSTGEITGGTPGATYSVTYTTSGSCSNSSTLSVTVLPQDSATFNTEVVCSEATDNGTIEIKDIVPVGSTIKWTNGPTGYTFPTGFDTADASNTNLSNLPTGNYTFEIEAPATGGTTTETLLTENFENTSTTLNNWNIDNSNTAFTSPNEFIINNVYGGGTCTQSGSGLPLTVADIDNQGAWATNNPQSNYLHISATGTCSYNCDEPLSVFPPKNANFCSSGGQNYFTMKNSINTIGLSNVTFDFYYICGAESDSGDDFGSLQYSIDGGSTWVNHKDYSKIKIWTQEIATNPAWDNQNDLRFRLKWQNDFGSSDDPPLAVDEIKITGEKPSAGCTQTVTETVTVSACTSCEAGSDQTLACGVTTTTLAATSPSSGTWTVTSGTGVFATGEETKPNATVTGLSDGDNVFQWSDGGSNTCTVTITSNVPTDPTFTAVAAICNGDTLNALPTTSTNGIDGTWSPALDNTLTTEYTFTPASDECANEAKLTITVNDKVDPTFTPVPEICEGGTLSALPTTSTNGITGTWSPVLDNTKTTEYTFTPDASECANQAKLTIKVNDKVNPTFTAVAAICEGGTLSALPTTSTNGIDGTWSPALDNTQTTEYTFTPDSDECANETKLTIIVNKLPTATVEAGNEICSGKEPSFTITGKPGATVTYVIDDLPSKNVVLDATTGEATVKGPNVTANSKITLSLVNDGTCDKILTETATVTVNPNIKPTFNPISPICEDSDNPLISSSIEGITGTWNPIFDSSIIGDTVYTFNPDSGQCVDNTTPFIITITVIATSNTTFTPVAAICEGESITPLPTTSLEGITGTWSPALDNTETTEYTFTPNPGQCAPEATLVIEVLENPTVTIIDNCEGPNYTLSALEPNENFTYKWYDAAGLLVSEETSIVIDTPGTYQVTVENSICSVTESVTVNSIFCQIPKGISPNGDGLNDTWELTNFDVKKVQIFNRYGVEVYSKNNYTNEWDGTSSGNELPSATYYYIIEFNNNTTKTGWVYINR